MPEQIAVLLLNADQEALPVSRTLEPVGVPFAVCLDTASAFRHRVVFIPFGDRPVRMTEGLRGSLQAFVATGGLLVLQTPPENTWSWLTGLESVSPGRKRKRLSFMTMADPIFSHLTEPEQQSIVLAAHSPSEAIWSNGLKPLDGSGGVVIADFPDTREGAIVRRRVGSGTVYTLGVDLRDMVVRPQAQRHFDAGRAAVNGFEPAADAWTLVWEGIYEQATPNWVRLRSAPGSGPLWLMTHDLGPGADLASAREFLRLESSRSAASTWFVQTRTSAEQRGALFFDNKVRSLLGDLRRGGDEIASHGVSYGSNFADLPMGGGETSADYRPVSQDDDRSQGATLSGEILVSKALLEGALSSAAVAGFRGPWLAYPPALDSALASAGYQYDSTLGANACLTHFPFLMVKGRAMAGESSVIEFPMTFTEEFPKNKPPEASAMLALAGRIAAYGGIVVWDIAPSPEPGQRARLSAVLSGAPKGTAWMTMGEAARFWARRHKTQFSFRPGASGSEQIITIRSPDGVGGLSFALSRPVKKCAGQVKVSCAEKAVAIDASVQATEAQISVWLE
jgi:hypothetical protein